MKSFTTFAAAALVFTLAQGCEVDDNIEYTFYGFPDNSPPSAQVAHDCGGRNYVAGGSGTYADPVTFATAPGEFSPCEIIYSPLLKKYIRYEDDCEQCISDYKSGKKHIDIWTGSATQSGGQTQIDCEDNLTSGGQNSVVRQPPQGLEVDSTPLFSNGKCNTGSVFESNKGSCSGASDSGNSTASAAPSSSGPSSGSSSAPSSASTSGSGKGSGKGSSGNDSGNGNSDSGSGDDSGDDSGNDSTPTSSAYSGASATATKKHKHKAQKTQAPEESSCDDE